MAYFPGVRAFEQLFGLGRGNLNINFPKIQMPRGVARGGGGCYSFDLTGTLTIRGHHVITRPLRYTQNSD